MKEIGSIFTLNSEDYVEGTEFLFLEKNTVYLSLARETLLYLAENIKCSNKNIMIPAYTCQTVIDPFLQTNWNITYYGIKKNLRIDTEALLHKLKTTKPDVIVFHPYYGMELNQDEEAIIRYAHEIGVTVIEDMTQVLFSNTNKDYVDYYLGSLRKWFNIPDGAFLYSPGNSILLDENRLNENDKFVQFQKDAMYLRGSYFKSLDSELKQISIRLNKYAVNLIAGQNIGVHCMSRISKDILSKNNIHDNKSTRLMNYNFLYNELQRSKICALVNSKLSNLSTAPLYFPIYVDNRTSIQTMLAENGIYAPVLWPVSTHDVIINDEVNYIYDHILLIPIDQRYGIEDMERVARLLLK